LLFLEIPILFYVLFPDATNTKPKVFDSWLHRHGPKLLIWAFTIDGGYLLGTGH
jgi:hypothetical protein